MNYHLPLESWSKTPIPRVSLDTAGLVALADLQTIPERTALCGSAVYLDVFVLCPGIHRQQTATELHGAEYPPTAALTSGYVFRVENPATVLYLQKVGRTGHLVHLRVSDKSRPKPKWTFWSSWWTPNLSPISKVFYLAAVLLNWTVVVYLVLTGDWWALVIVGILMLARLGNIAVVRRRSHPGWHGVPEPGVEGDLLILLSQDRWIRMRGSVDDLKVVTSGQWMRDMTFTESCVVGASTLLVYMGAALASNADQSGKIALLALLLISPALLVVSNKNIAAFQMFGRSITVEGEPKAYKRRLDLAEELIKSTKRDDWAIRLGMINPETARTTPVML